MEPELEVFQQFKPRLALAICDSILDIAVKCQSRHLIKDTYDEILQLSKTTKAKAYHLLGAIEKCIATDCTHYRTFMDILDEELPNGCKKPLSEMDKELKLLRERYRTCSDTGMSNEDSVIDVPQPTGGSKTYYTSFSKQSSLKRGLSNSSVGKSESSYSRTVSTDSGISVVSTDSWTIPGENLGSYSHLNSISEESKPLEETPLPNNGGDKSDKCTTRKRSYVSPLAHTLSDRIHSLVQNLYNVERDVKQKEAIEISLKDELEQLREKMSKAVVEKNEAQVKVRGMEKELSELKEEKDSLKRELVGKVEEVDGLEERLSAKEADIERLTAQMNKCQKEISDKTAEIERKDRTIDDLNTQIKQAEIHLRDRTNVESTLEIQRSRSSEYRAEIERKDAQISIQKAEMKAIVKAKDEEIVAKKRERKCLCRVLFILVAVLVVVVSFGIGVVYFGLNDSICGYRLKKYCSL